MKKNVKIEFNTSKYEYEYGRSPKGRGVWAFRFEGYEESAPSSTYGEAKKWISKKVREMAPDDYCGTVIVEVLT